MDMQNVAKLDIPEGEARTIHDKDGNLIWGKVSYGVKYKGDMAQTGTPAPSAPVAVQTVTGEQTVFINGAAHTVNLGSIELCGLGDGGAGGYLYQDYIYPIGGKWYVHKAISKEVLDGSGTWTTGGQNGAYIWRAPANELITPSASSILADIICSHLEVITFSDIYYARDTGIAIPSNNQRICISTMTDAATTKAWLNANTPSVYYALATPTDTEITNEALVAQLEAVEQWLTRYGYNATVSGNLPIVIDRTAL